MYGKPQHCRDSSVSFRLKSLGGLLAIVPDISGNNKMIMQGQHLPN